MNPTRVDLIRDHLLSSSVSAKRCATRAAATESWFHYYAGFPSSFASGIFRAARLGDADRILDPWNGSGTSTEAARSAGVRAFGVDMNPVANLVGCARLASAVDAGHASGLVDDMLEHARLITRERPNPSGTEALHHWLPPRCATFVRAFLNRVLHLLATPQGGPPLNPLREPLPPLAALLTLAMSRAIRTIAPLTKTSNPAWLLPNKASRLPISVLSSEYRAQVRNMVSSLRLASTTRETEATAQVSIFQGDARRLPIQDNSISFVLTSPPYLTRVDYVIPTALELAILGSLPNEIDTTRREMMGTPLVRGTPREAPRAQWGTAVQQVLSRVANHPAADSYSYYYKTFWQYFDDAYKSLLELRRVLTADGLAPNAPGLAGAFTRNFRRIAWYPSVVGICGQRGRPTTGRARADSPRGGPLPPRC